VSNHPLSGFGNFDPDKRSAKDEWLHEEAVVKALLTAHRNLDAKMDILEYSEERVGRKLLTLSGMREVTGISDQFLFESAVLPGIGTNSTVDKLLQKFETRKLTQLFFERYDERNEDLSGLDYALIVRCPYVKIGLVLHTSTSCVFKKTARFVFNGAACEFTMESYEQFAKTELRGAGR